MKILIGGDFCPENRAETLLRYGSEIFTSEYKETWQSADFRILNLEGPITNHTKKSSKVGRHIKFDPKIINGVKQMEVTHFSLSNNHIMDFSVKGITDTITTLKKANISYFGCHGCESTILEKDKIKVAILSFTNKEFSLMEDNDGFGACSMDLINILEKIKSCKAITNNVIVILHTGLSKYPLPSPAQKKLCRFLIDSGASAILCQHSHIMGAFENYKNGFISYGQGSFVFDLNKQNSFWNKGYSIIFNFSKNGFETNLLPHIQFDNELNIRALSKPELKDFYERMTTLNKILKDEDLFNQSWKTYLKKVEKYYLNQFFLPKNKHFKYIVNLINFTSLIPKGRKKILLNNIRNDEHSEVLIALLQKN